MLTVERLQAGYGPAQVLFEVTFAVGAGEVSSGRVCGALTHPPASATARSATIDRGALLMFQTKRA